MKLIKTLGLCLASMLVLVMALAGTAAAEEASWLLCLKGTPGSLPTKYTTNQCTAAAGGNNGEWESVALGSKSDTVRILVMSLALEDTRVPLKVRCPHVTGVGLIENRNLLLVRQAKVPHPSTECTAEGGEIFKICKAANLEIVEGIHLPWKVEFEKAGGQFISKIQPDGAGEPGWAVRCAGVEDACISTGPGTLEETTGSNAITEGVLLVFGEFKKANLGKCSVGGAGAGKVEGFIAILLASGNGLSLH